MLHPYDGVIKFRDASEEAFKKELVAVSKRLHEQIAMYASGYDMADGKFSQTKRNLIRLETMREQVDALLLEAGYTAAVGKFIRRYEPLTQKIKEAWRSLGVPVGFRSADIATLRFVADNDAERFANVGSSGLEVIKQGLTESLTGGAPFDSFRTKLGEVLFGSDLRDRAGHGMFRHAGTLATTAISQMNRTADALLAAQAGVEKFQYIGGIIESTREWCAERDGRIFTRDEIDAMDNGQTSAGSVLIAGGGWLCRHSWSPIIEESEASVAAAEEYAQTADYQRARYETEAAGGIGGGAYDEDGTPIGVERTAAEEAEIERARDLLAFREVTAEEFVAARPGSEFSRAGFLSATAVDAFAPGSKFHLTPDGLTGYVLTPEGDLQNVFNNGGISGAGSRAIQDAIERGAKTLDCFDGWLPKFYARFGFKETSRIPWDDAYAPAGWDYARDGRPDVVYMKYDAEAARVAKELATEAAKEAVVEPVVEPVAPELPSPSVFARELEEGRKERVGLRWWTRPAAAASYYTQLGVAHENLLALLDAYGDTLTGSQQNDVDALMAKLRVAKDRMDPARSVEERAADVDTYSSEFEDLLKHALGWMRTLKPPTPEEAAAATLERHAAARALGASKVVEALRMIENLKALEELSVPRADIQDTLVSLYGELTGRIEGLRDALAKEPTYFDAFEVRDIVAVLDDAMNRGEALARIMQKTAIEDAGLRVKRDEILALLRRTEAANLAVMTTLRESPWTENEVREKVPGGLAIMDAFDALSRRFFWLQDLDIPTKFTEEMYNEVKPLIPTIDEEAAVALRGARLLNAAKEVGASLRMQDLDAAKARGKEALTRNQFAFSQLDDLLLSLPLAVRVTYPDVVEEARQARLALRNKGDDLRSAMDRVPASDATESVVDRMVVRVDEYILASDALVSKAVLAYERIRANFEFAPKPGEVPATRDAVRAKIEELARDDTSLRSFGELADLRKVDTTLSAMSAEEAERQLARQESALRLSMVGDVLADIGDEEQKVNDAADAATDAGRPIPGAFNERRDRLETLRREILDELGTGDFEPNDTKLLHALKGAKDSLEDMSSRSPEDLIQEEEERIAREAEEAKAESEKHILGEGLDSSSPTSLAGAIRSMGVDEAERRMFSLDDPNSINVRRDAIEILARNNANDIQRTAADIIVRLRDADKLRKEAEENGDASTYLETMQEINSDLGAIRSRDLEAQIRTRMESEGYKYPTLTDEVRAYAINNGVMPEQVVRNGEAPISKSDIDATIAAKGSSPEQWTQSYIAWNEPNLNAFGDLIAKSDEITKRVEAEQYTVLRDSDFMRGGAETVADTIEQLKESDAPDADATLEKYQKLVEEAELCTRTNDLETLASIIRDGRLKSQFEVGRSNGTFSYYSRSESELTMFDIDPLEPFAHRPVYGYMSSESRPGGTGGGAVGYGSIRIVLNDDARARATITGTDSLGLQSTPTELSDPSLSAIVHVGSPDDADEVNDALRKVDDARRVEELRMSAYVEAQVHHGVPVSDIKAIHLDVDGKLSAHEQKYELFVRLWADKHNIPVYLGNDTTNPLPKLSEYRVLLGNTHFDKFGEERIK